MGGTLLKPRKHRPKPTGSVKETTPESKPQNTYVNVPPAPERSPPKLYKAVFSYDACYTDDLSFKVGDRLQVLIQSDGRDCEWWYAMHTKTNKKGYIPSNYVILDDDSIESQDWWYAVDRSTAMKQILLPGNPVGTFVIRPSSVKSDRGKKCLALTVLDQEQTGERRHVVRHFLIRVKDDGHSVFINPREQFASLKELVAFYSKRENNRIGVNVLLTKPCPKEKVTRPLKDISVDADDLILGSRLGAGCFGEVYAGTFRGVVNVAVKTLKAGAMQPQEFLQEAEIMNKLRHPKLVQLLGVCSNPLYIITELMSNGALLDCLRKDGGRVLKFATLVDMAAQVADGMSYLELKSFIHRDLRAANILVGDNNVVKVADFGLSRILDVVYEHDDVYKTGPETKFPIRWTAPEAFASDSEGTFSVKSDVWSFGILLYEIVTYGLNPYYDIPSTAEVRTKVLRGHRMPNPHGMRSTTPGGAICECPESLYRKMTECWSKDPVQRPTFEFLKHFLYDFPVASEMSYAEPGI